MNFDSFAKMLILLGVVLLLVGFLLLYFKHIPWLGKLPGDILFKRNNFTFYFPLTTSILLSIILSLLLYFFTRK